MAQAPSEDTFELFHTDEVAIKVDEPEKKRQILPQRVQVFPKRSNLLRPVVGAFDISAILRVQNCNFS